MAGFQTGAYSLPQFDIGLGQGGQSKVSPEVLQMLMQLMGTETTVPGAPSLFSQHLSGQVPLSPARPFPTPAPPSAPTATDPLTGQPIGGGSPNASNVGWIGDIATDIAKKVGPLVAPAPANQQASIQTGAYRLPGAQDVQNAVQPVIQAANSYLTNAQNIPSGEPVNWGDFYTRNVKPTDPDLAKKQTQQMEAFQKQAEQWYKQLGQDMPQGLKDWFSRFGRPESLTQEPFHRGPEQTPPQNIAAALGNATINLPQTLGQASWNVFGQPFVNAGQMAWNWATTPENQQGQKQAVPQQAPWKPGFGPGAGGQPTAPGTTTGGLPLPAPLDTKIGTSPTGNFVQQMIGVESGGNPTAKNPLSSATGLGQFTSGTWLEFINSQHPGLFDKLSKKEILALRNDPTMSIEASSWYAGKGVDMLDDLGLPITNANLYAHHFLGEGGARKLLTADPDAMVKDILDAGQIRANPTILGGNRTVQDVLDWMSTKFGESEPRGPTPRPQEQMPDLTQFNNWVDQMAPRSLDPALIQNARLGEMLAGIGQGLGSVNARQEGGGALFGALASGAGTGARMGNELALKLAQDDETARQTWASNRSELELKLAQMKSNLLNGNMDRAWQDQQDINTWLNTQNQSAIDARKAAIEASKPKQIHVSDNSLVVQNADGTIQRYDFSQNTLADRIKETNELFGMDSNQSRQFKYASLAQGGDMNSYQMEIVRDLVKDGLAEQAFGPAYQEAFDRTRKGMEGQTPGTKEYNEELNRRLSGWLFTTVAQAGDPSWIQRAAALGNPGAVYIYNNRTQ